MERLAKKFIGENPKQYELVVSLRSGFYVCQDNNPEISPRTGVNTMLGILVNGIDLKSSVQ
jgi:hypothetical protein